jgi:GNAT superfamily N-acetyltransferase
VTNDTATGIRIARWDQLTGRADLLPGLDAIFFEASATKTFASDEARLVFRERWLGRYLTHFPQYAFLALAPGPVVRGYVVGSVEDPNKLEIFRDIAHFASFRALTRKYPAQLHINIAPDWRSRGLGARLIDTFCAAARGAGAPGVHVVTARGMRNVRFYEAIGFVEAGQTSVDGRELLFLARSL